MSYRDAPRYIHSAGMYCSRNLSQFVRLGFLYVNYPENEEESSIITIVDVQPSMFNFHFIIIINIIIIMIMRMLYLYSIF